MKHKALSGIEEGTLFYKVIRPLFTVTQANVVRISAFKDD